MLKPSQLTVGCLKEEAPKNKNLKHDWNTDLIQVSLKIPPAFFTACPQFLNLLWLTSITATSSSASNSSHDSRNAPKNKETTSMYPSAAIYLLTKYEYFPIICVFLYFKWKTSKAD